MLAVVVVLNKQHKRINAPKSDQRQECSRPPRLLHTSRRARAHISTSLLRQILFPFLLHSSVCGLVLKNTTAELGKPEAGRLFSPPPTPAPECYLSNQIFIANENRNCQPPHHPPATPQRISSRSSLLLLVLLGCFDFLFFCRLVIFRREGLFFLVG